MWRNAKDKNQVAAGKVNNNRLRLVIAVIFLLIGSLVYKLYSIQIRQFDLYTAMAASQHQVYSKLQPERGKIYLREEIAGQEKLYPLATNKEFAEVFAVPKDIVHPEIMAEKLFKFFDEPKLLAELKEQAASGTEVLIATSTKEEIIAGYMKRLDKPGDPYEPLVNKLAGDDLVRLYSFLSSTDYASTSSPALASPEELEIKFGRIVYQNDKEKEFIVPGLGFNSQAYRYYPEKEIGSHLSGFVAQIDSEGHGRYGLEEFFDEELFGQYGSLKSEKAGQANVMIVNEREYVKPESGSDFILTIDRNIQFAACEKLKQAVEKHNAEGGTVIVMAPKTGEIIAMCSAPDFDPNDYRNVEDISVYNNPAILYQY